MTYLSSAPERSGQGAQAPRPATLYEKRRTKRPILFYVAILATPISILSMLIYWLLISKDFSNLSIIGGFIDSVNEALFISIAIWSGAIGVVCAAVLLWLRHYMPLRTEIDNDFINALCSANILTSDMRPRDLKYRIKIYRFKRRAEIRFRVFYSDRGFTSIQDKGRDMKPAFRRLRRYALEELTGVKADRKYSTCLILYYGDDDE